MYQIRQTEAFSTWLAALSNKQAKARILAGLDSVRLGNLGDTKSLGGGIHEIRVHVGPGYRVYFSQHRRVVLILLCGGDKSTQSRDIARAKRLLKELNLE